MVHQRAHLVEGLPLDAIRLHSEAQMTGNYRSAVGPPEWYDLIGALQFRVLTDLGLRDTHYLLDVGCGSLRGGRLFIPYLLPGRYCGVEPQRHLVDAGMDQELGRDILEIKRPAFLFFDDFQLTQFGIRFDYILAHSIFTHAAQRQIGKCLAEARQCIVDDGLFVGTWFEGESYAGDTWAPEGIAYTEYWMEKVANEHGWSFEVLDYDHPSGQSWFLMRPQ